MKKMSLAFRLVVVVAGGGGGGVRRALTSPLNGRLAAPRGMAASSISSLGEAFRELSLEVVGTEGAREAAGAVKTAGAVKAAGAAAGATEMGAYLESESPQTALAKLFRRRVG